MRQIFPLMATVVFPYAAAHHDERVAWLYSAVYIRRMADPIMHDAEAKKAMDSRLARIEGQVRAVRRMIGEDEPCEDIAQQLAAARKALDRAFYEMVSCMIRQEPPPGNQGRADRAGRVAELLARFG
jgi:DNA-binding FrmR family transcriptional regulator